MGLSFHDKSSMMSDSIGSLRFTPADSNTIIETEISNVVDEERRDDDIEVNIRI